MSKLKVGVVGVGALGRHHARIYSQMEGVELVAVADSHADRGRAVAEQTGATWFRDHADLVGKVEAVSIAVPTVGHLEVAAGFLERGIPVMVEKPLALNVSEGAALVELADRSGAALQVGHVERFNPAFQALRKRVSHPKYIRAERYSPYAFRSTDIGVVLDVMIHDLDMILELADSPLASVDAFGVSILGENEDCAQARLTFANGCVADVSANRVNPTSKRLMQVWSSGGCAIVDFGSRELTCYAPSDRLRFGESPLAKARKPGANIDQLKAEIFGSYVQVEQPEVSKADALTAELASFVECIVEERTPIVDGHTALAAMTAAERVLQSIADHAWNGAGAVGPVGPHFAEPAAQRRAA